MAFCGQFVVVCVVNVVVWRALFRGRKIRHVFELYFLLTNLELEPVGLGPMFRTEGLIERIEQERSFAWELLCVIVRKDDRISSLNDLERCSL
jgi:hypothetical protein